MSDFLNPKSMLTPGIAGALMMFLANALCAAFPEVAFRYVALGLSFAIGLVVLQAAKIQLSEKAAYWFLNSLIIFSTGVGASNIAANIEAPVRGDLQARAPARAGSVLDWLVSDAAAQVTPARDERRTAADGRDADRAEAERRAQRARAERERPAAESAERRRTEEFFRQDPPKQGFFRRW